MEEARWVREQKAEEVLDIVNHKPMLRVKMYNLVMVSDAADFLTVEVEDLCMAALAAMPAFVHDGDRLLRQEPEG
jgi:hypothetical protein